MGLNFTIRDIYYRQNAPTERFLKKYDNLKMMRQQKIHLRMAL